jgi:Co/Zn/Cd efflux system component
VTVATTDCSVDALREKQRGTLQSVLGINAVLFLVILVAALYARSTALLADSRDNLGDALTYGLSLYAVSRDVGTKAKVALFKGGLIFLAACVVATQVVYKLFVPSTPIFEIMGAFSLVGLVANSVCLLSALAASTRRCKHEFRLGVLTKRYCFEPFGFLGRWRCLAVRFRLARHSGGVGTLMPLDAFCDSRHCFGQGRR